MNDKDKRSSLESIVREIKPLSTGVSYITMKSGIRNFRNQQMSPETPDEVHLANYLNLPRQFSIVARGSRI